MEYEMYINVRKMYDVMPMEWTFIVWLIWILLLAAEQTFSPVSAGPYKFISTVNRAKFLVADNNKFFIQAKSIALSYSRIWFALKILRPHLLKTRHACWALSSFCTFHTEMKCCGLLILSWTFLPLAQRYCCHHYYALLSR